MLVTHAFATIIGRKIEKLTSITPFDMIEMVFGVLPSTVSIRIFLYRALIHFPACAEFPIFTMFHSACFILRPSLTTNDVLLRHKTHLFTHNFHQYRRYQNESLHRQL